MFFFNCELKKKMGGSHTNLCVIVYPSSSDQNQTKKEIKKEFKVPTEAFNVFVVFDYLKKKCMTGSVFTDDCKTNSSEIFTRRNIIYNKETQCLTYKIKASVIDGINKYISKFEDHWFSSMKGKTSIPFDKLYDKFTSNYIREKKKEIEKLNEKQSLKLREELDDLLVGLYLIGAPMSYDVLSAFLSSIETKRFNELMFRSLMNELIYDELLIDMINNKFMNYNELYVSYLNSVDKVSSGAASLIFWNQRKETKTKTDKILFPYLYNGYRSHVGIEGWKYYDLNFISYMSSGLPDIDGIPVFADVNRSVTDCILFGKGFDKVSKKPVSSYVIINGEKRRIDTSDIEELSSNEEQKIETLNQIRKRKYVVETSIARGEFLIFVL